MIKFFKRRPLTISAFALCCLFGVLGFAFDSGVLKTIGVLFLGAAMFVQMMMVEE